MAKVACLWAVYQMTIKGNPSIVRVVCEQSEWDQLDKTHPCAYTLIRSAIANETEAERLAREPITPLPPVPVPVLVGS